MDISKLFEWLDRNQQAIGLYTAPLIIVLIVSVYALVYLTGGSKFVYAHAMYAPILLSGFVYGIRGGVLIGLLGGLALGPLMPLDVAADEAQKTANWISRAVFFILMGLLTGAVSNVVQRYLRHLNWAARHDAATQLPNRRALQERLSIIILGNSRTSDDFLLAALSLENARELASVFGSKIIENITKNLAKRFSNVPTQRTRVYRLDSHTVAVLLPDDGENEAGEALDSLLHAAKKPFSFEGVMVHADMRMGFAKLDKALGSADNYINQVETAIAMAQQKEQERVAYSPLINNFTKKSLAMLGDLKHAIESNQLSLHYQPKIAIASGKVHSVEALMRWQHPELGNIPPGAFIARAEQSTLIHLLTEYALKQAMEQIVAWQHEGIDIPIAVNISTRNLIQPGFSNVVLNLLNHYNIDGKHLELEVTEGAMMLDMQCANDVLSELAREDIVISIDDFGTGYSSLQYLHELPISLIKIDQLFVRKIDADNSSAPIIEAALSLTKKMGIKAIAEGVENESVLTTLAELGCDFAQGFFISPPLAAKDYTEWHKRVNGYFR